MLATEFPVSGKATKASFIANVSAWLKGTRYSKIFDNSNDIEEDADFSSIRAASGEELSIREISEDQGLIAIGFRHDNPDNRGRLWRTEAVLKFATQPFEQSLIRIRTLCVAQNSRAILEVPKKPYLIKSLLIDDWGGDDGLLKVSDVPLFLAEATEDIDLAANIVSGLASRRLPIVYISANSNCSHELAHDSIEKLAYDLGGIAHIVVEPNRRFSFELRELAYGRNAYGGTIGIYAPTNGLSGRVYRNWQHPTEQALSDRVKETVTGIRSRMPAAGWDWTELQEFALRQRRKSHGEDSDFAELEQLYLEEISTLKEQITDYRKNIESLNASLAIDETDDSSLESAFDSIKENIGGELYNGEILDRLRLAAQIAQRYQDREGTDARSIATFSAIVESVGISKGLCEFFEQLSRTTKDLKNLHVRVPALLAQHGFDAITMNKHAKMTPRSGMLGLGPITVPITSSDYRASQNLKSQIINELGLNKLGA